MVNFRLPSLALVMCVRDEEDFIGENLRYHQALGVSRAYIFADRCKDSTVDIVKSLDWAKVIDAPSDPDRPLGTHQKNCADEGLEMARRDGIDWLMFIDADEFAFADNNPFRVLGRLIPPLIRLKNPLPLLARGNLRVLLGTAKTRTKQIILEPKEAVPVFIDKAKPFWSLCYFHSTGLKRRRILDPLTGTIKLVPWLGHTMGKSIVRTNANVQAAHSHRWTWKQGKAVPDVIPLPSERKGFIYHFVFFNFQNWLSKFQKHSCFPEKYICDGPIEFPKRSWKIACPNMSAEEAEHYYRKWIAMSDNDLEKYLADGSITKETNVQDVLCKFGEGKASLLRTFPLRTGDTC